MKNNIYVIEEINRQCLEFLHFKLGRKGITWFIPISSFYFTVLKDLIWLMLFASLYCTACTGIKSLIWFNNFVALSLYYVYK